MGLGLAVKTACCCFEVHHHLSDGHRWVLAGILQDKGRGVRHPVAGCGRAGAPAFREERPVWAVDATSYCLRRWVAFQWMVVVPNDAARRHGNWAWAGPYRGLLLHVNHEHRQRVGAGQRLPTGGILQTEHHSVGYPCASSGRAAATACGEQCPCWAAHVNFDGGCCRRAPLDGRCSSHGRCVGLRGNDDGIGRRRQDPLR